MRKEDREERSVNAYAFLARWFETGCDLVLLNLLWLACCLPVLTVGASTAAMHYVVRKMAAGEHYTVAGDFFHGFRQNWKQGTALWVLLVVLTAICIGDFYAGSRTAGWTGTAFQIIAVLTALAVVAELTLAFPMMVRYQVPFFRLLKNSLLLALSNPHIILTYAASAAALPVLAVLNGNFLFYAVPVWIFAGGAVPVLVTQLLLRPVYARLEQ